MRCILGLRTCLLGLVAVLFLFAACGQNEGGRCQINSDCASGLTCQITGSPGNGQCKNLSSGTTEDAASGVADDSSASLSIEVGSESATAPAIDAEPIEADAVDSTSID